MMKEIIFTIISSLFLAAFMADPVQANYWSDQNDADFVPENGAGRMEFGSYLIFMTSLMTVLMSKMMH